MQIIYPWQHPLFWAIISFLIIIIGITGIVLLSYGIKLIRKKSEKTIRKFSFTSFGGLMIFFLLYNFFNYFSILSASENKFIGLYINDETGYQIELSSNNTWTSTYEGIACKKGIWKSIINEEFRCLELKGNCEEYFFVQVYNYGDSFLEFGIDQNNNQKAPILRYQKKN